MRLGLAGLLMVSLLVCACSDGGSNPVLKDSGTDQVAMADSVEDATADVPQAPEDAASDLPDEPDLRFPDAAPDAPFVECEPGTGCFLDPCTKNADCQSGYCVEHLGAAVCTQACQDECPPGWRCQQVAGTEPDVVFICVSDHANLCKPCAGAADCKSVGGVDDVCVAYGGDGSFCGGACATSADCPWGFSCVEATTVGGAASTQCVADAGVCPCTEKSTALALATPCTVTNEFGTCHGQRTCTTDGLTPCDAATPAAETCNGLDDNCDGDVDEPGYVDGEFLPLCDDGNDCTQDLCLGADGCEHTVQSEGECKDGDPCTVGDHCEEGICIGAPVLCDDSNPCTDDSCDGLGGCQFEPNHADCDDGDACTVGDTCKEGACVGTAIACDCLSDADCAPLEDGNACNGTLSCDTQALPYQCRVDPETVVTCPEPPAGPASICQQASCDPATGACSLVPDHEGFACDDGDACTVGDQCSGGECVAGVAALCSDNNPCTDDSCDPGDGCLHQPNTAACNDANPCTTGDACADGVCVGGPALACDDANACTDDSCDPAVGCVHAANTAACDDGNACTVTDQCAQGSCKGTGSPSCDDENPCTTDSCDPATGCVHALSDAPCNDGDLCTTEDHCHLGECIGGGALACDDSNPCTDDACAPKTGCVFKPNTLPCDDGSACSLEDQCKGGWCTPGPAPDCDDSNPCTTDSCDPETGCQNVDNTAPCDDGDICTTGDACADGACASGPALDCDDGNPCTDDTCVAPTGCQHVPNAAPCDDDDLCTLGDICAAGACVPGADTPDCDDANPCTDDACVPEFGCIHVHNAAPCDDGDACTEPDACAAGTCASGPPVVCPDDSNTCTQEACDPAVGCDAAVLPDCCGNGEVEPGETCDDGNQEDGDGCSADCQSNGIWAFGEFRPAMKCGDFQHLGNDYMQYCFQLKGQTLCTGQTQGGSITCANTADGIRFIYDWDATWPMRFTPGTPSCMNYQPDYLQNFAHAIGYAHFEILEQKTGNSCTRTWINDSGNFQQTGGDSNDVLPYDIRYWN